MDMRFPLAEGRGWLTVREEGRRAVCQAQLPDDGRGLYKVYLRGAGGRFTLGTLLPEAGTLCLRRAVPLDTLEAGRIWPPTGGETELVFSAGQPGTGGRTPSGRWRPEPCPQGLMGDRLLIHAVAGVTGALTRREGDGFRLALPWDVARPFPLVPLFCFAYPERLDGRVYMMFHFTGQGCPRFPHKGNSSGES